jgi:hypothetical protein
VALTPGALTKAIEDAYKTEWGKAKPNPLPDAGADDRRLLFAGVARGILEYLKNNPTEILSSIQTQDEGGVQATFQVLETDFNVDAS